MIDKEEFSREIRQTWQFLKIKLLKPSFFIPGIVFLILAISFSAGVLLQKRLSFKPLAVEDASQRVPEINIFSDDVERSDFFTLDGNPSGWILSSSIMKKSNFTLVSSGDGSVIPYSGSKMLGVANNNEALQSAIHAFYPALKDGIVRASFYDYNDDRSTGTAISIANSFYIQNPSDSSAKAMILQIDHGKTSYTYRSYTEGKFFDVGTRSAGWHTVEFRLMSCGGAYIVLDGQPYSNYPIVSFIDISAVSVGRVWRGYSGNTYFDKLEVTNYFVPMSSLTNQQILDNWSDFVYEKYKITGADSSLLVVPTTEPRIRTSNSRFRFLADQAQMHLYYYYSRCEANPKKSNCDPADLTKAKNIIKAFIDNYEDSSGKPRIGQIWLSTVTMNQNFFNTWWSWKDLEVSTKQKFALTIAKEADFWTWALNEIKTNPNGQTIPKEAGVRTNNLSLLTSDIATQEYLRDIRAEEISPIAQFLATAALMFPDHQNSAKWEEAAKCIVESPPKMLLMIIEWPIMI